MACLYIATCPDYEPHNVEAALLASLQPFVSANPLIKAGQRVILKVNLLQGQPPEKAVTTHPALVAAVARWVKACGATPVIADSPGGLPNARILRHIYDVTGMTRAAEESGAELNYDVGAVQLPFPEGKATKSLDVARAIAEADAIISLPKLKTHGLTQFTGAIKNLFGTVPGTTKAAYHARFMAVDRFSAMLIDLLQYHKPVLSIMDAIVGMEGDGPSGGDPRHIGLILTSTDAVAVDVVATAIVGMRPSDVPPIAAAVRRGLSTGRAEDVEVLGSSIDAVRVANFKLPGTGSRYARMFPDPVPKWISDQLVAKPQAGDKCTGCGICAENCPTQAITIIDGKAYTDHKHCTRCYCCHELCPEEAVELHKPLMARLLGY